MKKFGIKSVWINKRNSTYVTKNLYKHNFRVDKFSRVKNLNQTPRIIWFTGLSGSGNQQYLMHWNMYF